jgi:hypothetical protein
VQQPIELAFFVSTGEERIVAHLNGNRHANLIEKIGQLAHARGPELRRQLQPVGGHALPNGAISRVKSIAESSCARRSPAWLTSPGNLAVKRKPAGMICAQRSPSQALAGHRRWCCLPRR